MYAGAYHKSSSQRVYFPYSTVARITFPVVVHQLIQITFFVLLNLLMHELSEQRCGHTRQIQVTYKQRCEPPRQKDQIWLKMSFSLPNSCPLMYLWCTDVSPWLHVSLQVEQLFCLGLRSRTECLKLLEMCDWNLEVASTQMLDNYGSTTRQRYYILECLLCQQSPWPAITMKNEPTIQLSSIASAQSLI